MKDESTRVNPLRKPARELTAVMGAGPGEEPMNRSEIKGAAGEQPKHKTKEEQTRDLVAQLRGTTEARFRSFSSRTADAEDVARRAGAKNADGQFGGINARIKALVDSVRARFSAIEREAEPAAPPLVIARESVTDPMAFVRDAESRLVTIESFVGGAPAAELRQEMARYREMIARRERGEAGGPEDAAFDAEFRSLEESVRKTELRLECTALEMSAVPNFLRMEPADVYKKLRDGAGNPRFFLETSFAHHFALDSGAAIQSPEDILAAYLPERAREPFHVLRSEQIPAAHRAEADRASNQLLNGCFEEAARTMEALRDRMVSDGEDGRDAAWFLEPMVAEAREAGKGEVARLEKIADVAGPFYEAMLLQDGRRESIRQRMEMESQFRNWNIVGIRPMADRHNPAAKVHSSNSPVWVELQDPNDPTRTVGAVMKFDFSDRWTRSGVSPGTGSVREAVGALAQVALGNDLAPTAVSRMTEEYGRVTIMEFVPGESCQRLPEWFMRSDGSPHPDIFTLAVGDFLLNGRDRATRNVMSDGNRLIPIDFGSEFASPKLQKARQYNSAAHYAVSTLGYLPGKEVRSFVGVWKSSPGRTALAEMVALIPDDMEGFIESVDLRVEEIRSAVENPPYAFPAYPEGTQRDVGIKIQAEIAEIMKKRMNDIKIPPNKPDNATYV